MQRTCSRCRRAHEFGHRDPDNHHWYCEDCWLSFCGKRRCCNLCHVPHEKGAVDSANEHWYCFGCWERRQSSQAPPASHPVAAMTPVMVPPGAAGSTTAHPRPAHMGLWPPSPGLLYPAGQLVPGYGLPLGYPYGNVEAARSGGSCPPLWYPPAVASRGAFSGNHALESRSRSPRRQSQDRRESGESDAAVKERKAFKPYHATQVPKATDLEAEFCAGGASAPPTTAMLRNIPNKFTQRSLREEIDEEGFAGRYDFFYLPMDVRNKTNVGYAFINFLEATDLRSFCHHFEGYHFKKQASQKIATVCPAHVQGLEKNIQHLLKKAVTQFSDGEYRPIVLRHGKQVDFEVVAKELRLQ